MFVAGVAAPTIIHHHFVLNGGLVEQPCQQFRAVPIGRSHLPLTIAEDYCRFVVRDQVLELREHVLAHVARLVVAAGDDQGRSQRSLDLDRAGGHEPPAGTEHALAEPVEPRPRDAHGWATCRSLRGARPRRASARPCADGRR